MESCNWPTIFKPVIVMVYSWHQWPPATSQSQAVIPAVVTAWSSGVLLFRVLALVFGWGFAGVTGNLLLALNCRHHKQMLWEASGRTLISRVVKDLIWRIVELCAYIFLDLGYADTSVYVHLYISESHRLYFFPFVPFLTLFILRELERKDFRAMLL